MKRHLIIYITGLGDGSGDKNVALQKTAIKWWQVFGVKTRLFQVGWANAEPYPQKLEKLLALIDMYSEKGHKVSLVGTSAGASVALAAFSRRKEAIAGVVCFCGKLRNPQTVQPRYYEQNPAFRDAMEGLAASLAKLGEEDRKRILSIRPLYDQTVAVADTKIDDAHHAIVPSFYHAPSIALMLTIFSPIAVFFLKRRSTISL